MNPIKLTLPSDLEQFVTEMVGSGQFANVDELCEHALRRFMQRHEEMERLRKEIAIGVEQAERGELLDGPEVFERIRQNLSQAHEPVSTHPRSEP